MSSPITITAPVQRPLSEVTGIFQSQTNRRYDSGQPKIAHLKELGFNSFEASNIISKVAGQAAGRNIYHMFEAIYGGANRIKMINSEKRRWKKGPEDSQAVGRVVSTVTGNGTGLASIQITVTGPDGSNSGTGWFSKNHQLIGQSMDGGTGRVFTVIDTITKNSSGQQILTLVPNNAVYDLKVVNGQSVDFPDNSHLGELGIASNDIQCYNPTSQRIWNNTEYENWMTWKKQEVRRDPRTMMNNWAYVFGFNGGPPELQGVQAYVEFQELQNYAWLNAAKNEGLLFDVANQNGQGGTVGAGLISQIPSKWKVPMQVNKFKQDPYGFLNEILKQYDFENPGYVSRDLMVCMGSLAFADLQQGLSTRGGVNAQYSPNTTLQDWREVPQTMDAAMQTLYRGEMYGGMVSIASGIRLHFVKMPAMDSVMPTGQRDLEFGTGSIYSHAMLILDGGMKRNLDFETGEVENTNEYKIGLFSPANPDGSDASYINVATEGLSDQFGNRKTSGIVYSTDPGTTRIMEVGYMATLEEDQAGLWISPTN